MLTPRSSRIRLLRRAVVMLVAVVALVSTDRPVRAAESYTNFETTGHVRPIALSPDGKVLYVADTMTSRLIAFDLDGPGVIRPHSVLNLRGARLVCGLPGYQWFDGLAVAESGNIAVATLITGKITVITPTGEILRSVDVGDHYVTNICFGGLRRRTAYITMAASSQLGAMDWDETGLALNHAR